MEDIPHLIVLEVAGTLHDLVNQIVHVAGVDGVPCAVVELGEHIAPQLDQPLLRQSAQVILQADLSNEPGGDGGFLVDAQGRDDLDQGAHSWALTRHSCHPEI